jgi:hypothetical protein
MRNAVRLYSEGRTLLRHLRVRGLLWGKTRRCPVMPPMKLVRQMYPSPLPGAAGQTPGRAAMLFEPQQPRDSASQTCAESCEPSAKRPLPKRRRPSWSHRRRISSRPVVSSELLACSAWQAGASATCEGKVVRLMSQAQAGCCPGPARR